MVFCIALPTCTGITVLSLKDSTKACDRVTKAHKRTADSLIGVATYMGLLSIGKEDPLSALYKKTSDSFEKIRVRRGRV